MAGANARRAKLAKRPRALDRERAAIVSEIEALRSTSVASTSPPGNVSGEQGVDHIHFHSSSETKIALFRRLFQGRPDVFPVRWENARTGHPIKRLSDVFTNRRQEGYPAPK
jgi:hypothetical protein